MTWVVISLAFTAMKSSVHHFFPPPRRLSALRVPPVDGATLVEKDGLAEALTVIAMTSSKYENQAVTRFIPPLCAFPCCGPLLHPTYTNPRHLLATPSMCLSVIFICMTYLRLLAHKFAVPPCVNRCVTYRTVE